MAKQYVQHISGQGAKWEVTADSEEYKRWKQWKVEGEGEGPYQYHYLPKSEYVLCEPPPPVAQWEDVTAECVLDECGAVMHNGFNTFGDETYRRRTVTFPSNEDVNYRASAIIIEQKVTEQ